MSIFNRRNRVKCETEFEGNNWVYSISIDGKTTRLPLELSKNINRALINSDMTMTLLLLDELYREEKLVESDSKYHLPVSQFDDLDEEDRDILNLPTPYRGKLLAESYLSPGSSGFMIEISIEDRAGHYTKSYSRYGRVIKFASGQHVLSKGQEKVFTVVDRLKHAESSMEQFRLIAELKTLARKTEIEFDSFLESEDIIFADEMELDVEMRSPREIEIVPGFQSLSTEQNELVKQSSDKKYHYAAEGENRTRVFLDDHQFEQLRIVQRNNKITGNDVPKFLKNPMPFIDDRLEFNLESFSERVKGLKTITYTAKPYIHVDENKDLNWFDFGVGVKLKPDNPDYDEIEIGLDEFSDLINDAEKHDGFASFENNWVDLDVHEGKELLKLSENLEKEAVNNQNGEHRLKRVLEIFENISDLEYNEDFLHLIEDIKEYGLDRYTPPEGLKVHLYNYQKAGFQWMKSLDQIAAGGLLADDMGLGKTVQVISYMQYLHNHEQLAPMLIVLPAALLSNWVEEIDRFSTGIKTHIYHRQYGRIVRSFEESDVYLTTYETLVNHQLELGKIPWNLIVCDEAQKIKNASTFAANAVKAMKTKRRMALTGTPVENGLNELWSIMDFVQPGLLGSYKSFRNNYEKPIHTNVHSSKVDDLLDKIKPVYIRRTKSEKLDGLPELDEHRPMVKMSNLQYDMYKEELLRGKRDPSQRLPAITRMLTIMSHPRALNGDISGSIRELLKESPKLEKTFDIIDSIKQKEEKVVIFTRLKRMQAILRRAIVQKYDIDPIIINGDTKTNRNALIALFSIVKGFNVMILSPKAAGIGLNVTAANHVIHYTRDWNPAVEKQATDRTYRIGQDKTVHVYYPITTSSYGETVEQKLDRLLNRKKALIERVVVTKDQFKMLDEELLERVFD